MSEEINDDLRISYKDFLKQLKACEDAIQNAKVDRAKKIKKYTKKLESWLIECGCRKCWSARRAAIEAELTPSERISRPFIVCETCGNKRCPHGTDHELNCTGSNEPGQPGSDYQ